MSVENFKYNKEYFPRIKKYIESMTVWADEDVLMYLHCFAQEIKDNKDDLYIPIQSIEMVAYDQRLPESMQPILHGLLIQARDFKK